MPTGAPHRSFVAVFGGSDAAPGTPAYDGAHEVGRRLAGAGLGVINGGYGGVMEASARGARELGGPSIGVTTGAFSFRSGPNPFIDTEVRAADLHDRTRRLIEGAVAFIILPGKSGTLAELAFLWALQRAGLLGPKPIVLLGEVWRDLIPELERLGLIGEVELAATRLARTPDEAVRIVSSALTGER